jgi:hypothetical protein
VAIYPPPLLIAQQPSATAEELKIVVIEGEGAQNSIRSRSAVAPVVEVRDAADKPVAGAEVVFQLPAAGPSGTFHNWMRNQTVRTNAEGRAAVTGYAPNDEEGRLNIKVTATSGTKTATAIIAQSNVRGSGNGRSAGGSGRTWKILAVVGAVAVAGGVVAATRGDGNGTSAGAAATPVTITPGTVTVGGPR